MVGPLPPPPLSRRTTKKITFFAASLRQSTLPCRAGSAATPGSFAQSSKQTRDIYGLKENLENQIEKKSIEKT